jgi:predicted translin family RNA/ssDNA-binding protein
MDKKRTKIEKNKKNIRKVKMNKLKKEKFTELNKDFDELNKEFIDYEKRKGKIIGKSRKLIKESKRVIYSIHRNEILQAESSIKKIETEFVKLKKMFKLNELEAINLYSAALQEYVEARTFLDFITKRPISTAFKLKIKYNDYLCGLADLTGELGRHAVICATNKQFDKVKKIKDFVEFLYGKFLKFDFNNGELRKKYDAIKWNLSKIEGILYDYSRR